MKIAVRKSAALKTVLLAVAACFVSTAAISSQVYLSNQTAAPGTSLLIPVAFASQNGSTSGVQFDLEYDGSAMSLSAILGEPGRNSGKRVYSADLTPNKRRFLVVGFNQNPLDDGVVMNFFVNLSQNARGVYALKLSNLVATDPDGQSVPFTGTDGAMTVQGTVGQGVRLQQNGVLSGGSLLSGPVAPGEVITLIGSGIGPASTQQPVGSPSSTVLAGTSVLFDGKPAPLLYAAPSQINAIVPFGSSVTTTTQLEVDSQGQAIARLLLSVATAVPAIFTLDSSGVGPGAILNQDSTVNSPSNPAEKGSVVSVFASGAGQTDPPSTDGQTAGAIPPSILLRVSVHIGGPDAQVLYAGGAPGLIAGIVQVNCLVPADAPSGPAVPIVLTVGTASSPAGVTVAIK
jgi:uncharacterized protein (TIGR03437 family)